MVLGLFIENAKFIEAIIFKMGFMKYYYTYWVSYFYNYELIYISEDHLDWGYSGVWVHLYAYCVLHVKYKTNTVFKAKDISISVYMELGIFKDLTFYLGLLKQYHTLFLNIKVDF